MTRAVRFVALFLWLGLLILLLLNDRFFMWMRDTKGFFYMLVILVQLGTLVDLASKGGGAKEPIVVVLVSMVLLMAGWFFALPVTIGLPIVLGYALILHSMRPKASR